MLDQKREEILYKNKNNEKYSILRDKKVFQKCLYINNYCERIEQ